MGSNQPNPNRSLATFAPEGEPTADREISILSPLARIGQGAQNDVVLDDDTVSTKHARLEFTGGAWTLTDLSSKNGTFVNGERLTPEGPVVLPDGAAVAFGALRLSFASSDRTAAEVAAQAYVPPAPAVKRATSANFRLPVWVLLLVLLLIGIILAVAFLMGGDPDLVDPLMQPAASLLHEYSWRLVA